jgi:hypothetical protein
LSAGADPIADSLELGQANRIVIWQVKQRESLIALIGEAIELRSSPHIFGLQGGYATVHHARLDRR